MNEKIVINAKNMNIGQGNTKPLGVRPHEIPIKKIKWD